ncbi:hypothetical protein [Mycobacterium leprae]|uniref:hypothetical protein n=1 Tax=Mycobacterium leprae TaxID=1769 RepID=UPI0018D48723|nr:hypothetical protein [Mycobacterium leprae]
MAKSPAHDDESGPCAESGMSRQAFLRGAVGVLTTGAVFGTARVMEDPAVG